MREKFGYKVFALLLTGMFFVVTTLSSFASELKLILRSVPLEISSYAEATDMDQKIATPESLFEFITSTKPLIVHMEALRRAYNIFGEQPDARQKLLKSLKERYMSDQNNPEKYFDYGYAQLVMEFNKNGLFFLRKADDRLSSPYTSLAYGLAQVDVDRYIDNAAPDELTTRKMDVGYNLKDALSYNKEDRLPGIWPSYIHIMEALKNYPAFDSLVNEDVSLIYLPPSNIGFLSIDTGDAMLASGDNSSGITSSPSQKSFYDTNDIDKTCKFGAIHPNWSNLAMSKGIDLDNDGNPDSVNFFASQNGGPYQVQVVNGNGKIIGEFASYKAPYITEDIEGDGIYELVIRQFDKNPYHPLYVYKWNGNCYGEDKRISSFFR